MKTVLVTGGCGLIGKYVCSGLIKKGFEVIAADKEESTHNMGKLHYTFVKWTPSDEKTLTEIFEQHDINILIHAACTVDNDWKPVVTENEVNESGRCDKYIYRLAMSAETIEQVIFISTDKVYDFPKTREPIQEDFDIKTTSNYAILKYESEKALVSELRNHKNVICCIARVPQVYTRDFIDNLVTKITDPKDNSIFVVGKGQYGFHMCCVHNLVDFILCFVKNANDVSYSGNYNVGDKMLTTADDIVSFMREHHSLGPVIQRSPAGALSKIKGIFKPNKEYKTNYRYLDITKLENNNMLDLTKASKIISTFRWNIHNTK